MIGQQLFTLADKCAESMATAISTLNGCELSTERRVELQLNLYYFLHWLQEFGYTITPTAEKVQE